MGKTIRRNFRTLGNGKAKNFYCHAWQNAEKYSDREEKEEIHLSGEKFYSTDAMMSIIMEDSTKPEITSDNNML